MYQYIKYNKNIRININLNYNQTLFFLGNKKEIVNIIQLK